MNLESQEIVLKLITEQAEKLSIAFKALRAIRRLTHATAISGLDTATGIAENAIREISDYGKNPKDL